MPAVQVVGAGLHLLAFRHVTKSHDHAADGFTEVVRRNQLEVDDTTISTRGAQIHRDREPAACDEVVEERTDAGDAFGIEQSERASAHDVTHVVAEESLSGGTHEDEPSLSREDSNDIGLMYVAGPKGPWRWKRKCQMVI